MMNDYEHIKNKIIIKYEDFVSNPDKTLNQISTLLQIKNEFQLVKNISPSINKKYFSQIESLRKSANLTNRRIFNLIRRLRKGKFPLFVKYDKEIDDIALRFEERIRKLGYSFLDINLSPLKIQYTNQIFPSQDVSAFTCPCPALSNG